MTAFLTVLAVLGWTLLALLVLAVLAFALPAWVLVDWRGGAWTLRARVLCVTVRLYPRPARKKREKTKKKRTEPAGPAAEKPPLVAFVLVPVLGGFHFGAGDREKLGLFSL